MKPILKIFKDPTDLAGEFILDFKLFAEKTITEKGIFNVALSGGSSPKIVFDLMAKNFKTEIPWENIHFFWGDERCVPPDHTESNYKMAKDLLLDQIQIPAKNIHRIKGEISPIEEAERYSREIISRLDNKDSLPAFDLAILGMGDDGHTASIFPDQMDILYSDYICSVAKHPVSGQKRISLTGKVINNSVKVSFLITGKNKALILKKIIHHEDNYLSYPASFIKPASKDLSFYIDGEASSLLKP